MAAMKRAAYYRWLIPNPITGRLKRARWAMTEDQAKAYPGAVRDDLAGVEWRDVPELGDATWAGNFAPPHKPAG